MIIQQILKTNEPNRNGHVYTNESMREAVKTFKVGKMYGTIGQYTPFDPIYSLNLMDISHQVIELTEENEGVFLVAVRVLDTIKGKIVKNLLSANIPLTLARRGVGELEEKDGVKVVTNYKLLAIDFIYPEED